MDGAPSLILFQTFLPNLRIRVVFVRIKSKSKSNQNQKKKFEKEKNNPVFEEGKMVFIFMDPRQNIPLRVANSGISVGSSKKRK